MRLRRGQFFQDCDVYIGPQIRNEHWNLEASKWTYPFHWCLDKQKALETYRQHVLNNKQLVGSLSELRGKRLGCFCDDHDLCHGSVLVQLVEESSRLHQIVDEISNVVYFKGSQSILSNLAEAPINYDGHHFRFLEQLRAYMMAQSTKSAHFLLDEILQCSSSYTASKLSSLVGKCCPKGAVWSQRQSVLNMVQLVEMKWMQVPSFQKCCQQHSGYFFSEATRSKFWGAGVDIHQIEPNTSITSIPGKNILGWIIYYVFCKSRFNEETVRNHLVAFLNDQPKCAAADGLSFLLETLIGCSSSNTSASPSAAAAEQCRKTKPPHDFLLGSLPLTNVGDINPSPSPFPHPYPLFKKKKMKKSKKKKKFKI